MAGRGNPLFAVTVPGLGRMLRRQLDAIDGIDVTGTGFDSRSDIVFFAADRAGRAAALRSRLAAGFFAEIGRASRAGGAGAVAVASAGWPADAVQRALSLWADEVQPLAGSMTFRVVAGVLGQGKVGRTDLRRSLADIIGRDKPRWHFADPAQLEICIIEYHDGQYVTGLRLAGTGETDRPRAVPPPLAAAMVELAGSPGTGPLLDPCCGAGAILAAALAAGWDAEGYEVDEWAVEAATRAASGASVQLGDARELLLPDDYVAAAVSRLPDAPELARPILAELSRVTRTGGSVVVLAPELPRSAIPGALRLRRQVPIRLLGSPTTIWVFRRA
jgi:SAM-dependent methyltransferase